MHFDTTKPDINWQLATKQASLLAKPACLVITDRVISQKLLLETLEGEERLGENAVICIGPFGDAWQQTAKKLLDKYRVVDITNDGWMVCLPLEGNAVQCVQITRDLFDIHVGDYSESFSIEALWGKSINGKNFQFGTAGDWVLRNSNDHSDVWIVKEKIFKNTYKVFGAHE